MALEALAYCQNIAVGLPLQGSGATGDWHFGVLASWRFGFFGLGCPWWLSEVEATDGFARVMDLDPEIKISGKLGWRA